LPVLTPQSFVPRLYRFPRFHIWRFGLYLFAREYLKYNQYFIVPGVSVDAVNGYDRYVDIEAKILFVGIGIRFIWIKRKVKR
jgi:hypothetical protein